MSYEIYINIFKKFFGCSKPQVFIFAMLILLNLSIVKVEDYYGDIPYGQLMDTEVMDGHSEDMINDDIIVSKVIKECPDSSGSMVDCNDPMHHNKESLIYPVVQFSTKRPLTKSTPPSRTTVQTRSGKRLKSGCTPENCEGSGGYVKEDADDEEDEDDEDEDDDNEIINMSHRLHKETTSPGRNDNRNNQSQSKNRTSNSKNQSGASSRSPSAQQTSFSHTSSSSQQQHQVQKPHNSTVTLGRVDSDGFQKRSSSTTPNPLFAVSPASNNNNHQTYMRNSQDVSSSSIKDRHFQQLAINMNIVLIAGIAAGIVVLLFILVVAACKFYASSTAPTGAKALNDYYQQQRLANKAAYAYEACNTGGKCSSPLLVPSSQQSLPVLNATSQAGLTSVGSATSTVSKPAKKDVKEWYV